VQLQSELASCHLQVPRLQITYSGTRRVDEQRDAGGRRKKLVQEFEPLRSHLCIQRHYAREVAAWSAQAGDKSKFDRIARYVEDDRNRRGRRLGRECRGRATAGEHYGHLAAHQIGRQRGQSIILPIRPTVFDRDVVALDIADLAQAAKESGDRRRIRPRGRRP
jgi:hypothetical protein